MSCQRLAARKRASENDRIVIFGSFHTVADVAAAVEDALAQFEKLGASRVAISLPNSALSVPAYYVIVRIWNGAGYY